MSLSTKDSIIVLDGKEFLVYRSFFRTSADAASHGFQSKSFWAKKGRGVIEDSPEVFVANVMSRTFRTSEDDVVFAYSQLNEYLVAKRKFVFESNCIGCWRVYSVDQTCEKSISFRSKVSTGKVNAGNNSNMYSERTNTLLNTSSSTTTTPYDGDNHIESEAKPNKNRALSKANVRTRLITKDNRTAKGKLMVYVPEGFPWEEHPELTPFRSSIMWFFHKLHERRFLNNQNRQFGIDDFITYKSEYARSIDPKFRDCIKLLLDLEVVERDNYQQGNKSYGYRFVDPELRKAKRHRVPLNDPALAKRIDKHRKSEVSNRTDRWLHSNLLKLALSDVDEAFLTSVAASSYRESGGSIEDKLEAYGYILSRISNQEHTLTPDKQGRRYSLVTNMKRELRSLLRVDGQPLRQIDIRSSQWLFLAIEMKTDEVACDDFFRSCEQGEFYERVAKCAGATRESVKKALTQRALFSPNDARCQQGKIKRTFDGLFPVVSKYLFQAKDKDHGGSKLAKRLQFAESQLIIDAVCGRFRREGKVRFITPVHDCLLFLPEDEQYVLAVMTEEFAKLGAHPFLEAKDVAGEMI